MSVVATVVVLQYHHHDPNGGNMPKWVSLEHIIISIHHTFQLLLWPKWPLSWILHSVVWAFLNLSLSSSAPPGFPPSVGGTCAVVCQAAYFKIRKYKKKKKSPTSSAVNQAARQSASHFNHSAFPKTPEMWADSIWHSPLFRFLAFCSVLSEKCRNLLFINVSLQFK